MANKILIITHSGDNAAIDKVSQRLQERGFEAVRIDTDTYPTEALIESFSDSHSHKQFIGKDGQHLVSSEDIHSIWYRRFYAGQKIPHDMESQKRYACLEESRRCLTGFLSCQKAFCLDNYWKVKIASVKDYQLQLASELGFDIPKTLVTNHPDSVRRFYDEQRGKIITKMQTSFAIWENNKEHVVFTNPVTEDNLNHLEGLALSPMVFQQHIEKKLELRVTVVGKTIFSAAIDSNRHDSMKNDWRKNGINTLAEWFPVDIPESLQQKILALMKALNLQYGAIDIILTPDDEYKFLEINPVGEFYWLDAITGFPICDTIADVLIAQPSQ